MGNYGMRARGTHTMSAGHCPNSWGSGGSASPPAGPGQSPGGGPGCGAPGSSLDFAKCETLKWLRILSEFTLTYICVPHRYAILA